MSLDVGLVGEVGGEHGEIVLNDGLQLIASPVRAMLSRVCHAPLFPATRLAFSGRITSKRSTRRGLGCDVHHTWGGQLDQHPADMQTSTIGVIAVTLRAGCFHSVLRCWPTPTTLHVLPCPP